MVSPETTTTSSSNPTTTATSLLHRFLLSSSNPINTRSDFINNPFGLGPLFRPPNNNITTFIYPQDPHHQHQSFPISDDQSQEMGHTNNNTRHLTDLLHTDPAGNDNTLTTTTPTTHHSKNNRLSLSLNSHHRHHQPGGFIQYGVYLDSSGEETSSIMGLSNEYSSFTTNPRNSTNSFTQPVLQTSTTTIHDQDQDQDSDSCVNNRFGFSSSYPSSFCDTYSNYLRPAQLLLEEMISLGGKDLELHQIKALFFGGSTSSTELRAEFSTAFAAADGSPEKHQLQIKMSKLIGLLEQVEMRYQEYCQRMDDIVSSFGSIAGEEAAKTYTAVALQAMCRHFCNLRDGILAQIKRVRRNLMMSNENFPRIRAGLSNLTLFDKESSSCRVNRAPFQQLGQQQTRAWRPIRGLPETSVAILRAWLFEHFLHPYPNESEKLILSSQTGLTKNQVSNWFINARVRLWKPMIEEMYKDEFGDQSSSAESDPFFSTTTCCSTRDDYDLTTTATEE